MRHIPLFGRFSSHSLLLLQVATVLQTGWPVSWPGGQARSCARATRGVGEAGCPLPPTTSSWTLGWLAQAVRWVACAPSNFFSPSPTLSGIAQFVFDVPTSYRSLSIIGARGRHAAVTVRAPLSVARHLVVGSHVILHLNSTVNAGKMGLTRRAVLSGTGSVTAKRFVAGRGSFISPGRSYVAACGPTCFQMNRKFAGIGYGELNIVVTGKRDADLSRATVIIKAIGSHVSFGSRTFDFLAVNKANMPHSTVLLLGSQPVKVKQGSGYDVVEFNATEYPPIEAVCIAGGVAGLVYSPNTTECRAFAVVHGLKAMLPWPVEADAKSEWESAFGARTVSSSQNWVPFRVRHCCSKSFGAAFSKTSESAGETDLKVRHLAQAAVLAELFSNPALTKTAPRNVRKSLRRVQRKIESDHNEAIVAGTENATSTVATVPPVPTVRVSSSPVFLAEEAHDLISSGVASSCVPSSSVLLQMGNCCPPGFTGPECKTVVPCTCSDRGTCSVTGTCLCDPGFTGSDCATPVCPSNSLGRQCSGPACGLCKYTVSDPSDSPRCVCHSNFTGPACSQPICAASCDPLTEECVSRGAAPACWSIVESEGCPICQNGGSCVNRTCVCPADFEGPSCQSPLCPQRCSGNGLCYIDERGRASCRCVAARFTGLGCEVEQCSSDRCLNGGICVTGPACQCPHGMGGPFCQERLNIANRNGIFAGAALSDGAILAIIVVCSLLAASLLVFFIINYRLRKNALHEAGFNNAQKTALLEVK